MKYIYAKLALKQDIKYILYRFFMRLTLSSDYALRLLMLVGLEPDRLVTIEEVADRFHISKNHLMKVAYQLGQAEYLDTVRGRNGGLRLGKAPDQIVVGEVVRTMEPDFAVVECEDPTGFCKITPACALRSAMREAVQAFLTKLDEYTLADLLRPRSRLRQLLGVDQKRAVA
jgi:Rrf2 family transcriptional regulator, nitric oxide-sensitive transcriptional repressor